MNELGPWRRLSKAELIERDRADRDDAVRDRHAPWRRWLLTPQWSAITRAQLAAEPDCRRCQPRRVSAEVCAHVNPHNADPRRFFGGPFQSLCKPCAEAVEAERAQSKP